MLYPFSAVARTVAQILFIPILFTAGLFWMDFGQATYSAQIVQDASVAMPFSIHTQRFQNGVRLYFIQTDRIPMVDIQIAIKAGSYRDGHLPGLSKLTGDLLFEGTLTQTGDEISQKLENLGVEYGVQTGRDATIVSVRALSQPETLKQVVAILADILHAPAFEASALHRQQDYQRQVLKQQAQRPEVLAQQKLYQLLYGDSGYGSWPDGSESSILQITPAHLSAFHQQYYVGHNTAVSIVGDVTKTQAIDITETITAALKPGQPDALPPIVGQAVGTKTHIPYDATQTKMLWGQVGIRGNAPDIYAVSVANAILGSGFTSRLFSTVRDQKGLAYHVGSQVLPMLGEGPILLQCQTRQASANEAIAAIEKEVAKLVTEGPTAEELALTKQRLKGQFIIRLESNADLVQALTRLGLYELPLDYFASYADNIDKVNSEDVKVALQRYFDPARFHLVTIGSI